jgi:hypothetical protein
MEKTVRVREKNVVKGNAGSERLTGIDNEHSSVTVNGALEM